MLHYYAKNFFAPVIVSTRLTHARELEIYVISDLHYALKHFFITINIYKWNSMVPISVQNISEVAVVSIMMISSKATFSMIFENIIFYKTFG